MSVAASLPACVHLVLWPVAVQIGMGMGRGGGHGQGRERAGWMGDQH